MNAEEIQNFLQSNVLTENKYLKITFKKRDPVFGIFLKGTDFTELANKNFWRIVTLTHLKEWQTSKDMSLSRIFNGQEFTRLAIQ